MAGQNDDATALLNIAFSVFNHKVVKVLTNTKLQSNMGIELGTMVLVSMPMSVNVTLEARFLLHAGRFQQVMTVGYSTEAA